MSTSEEIPEIPIVVEIRAELRQIKTIADGTVNITLNLPEDCLPQVKILLDWLKLEIGALMINSSKNIEAKDRYGL